MIRQIRSAYLQSAVEKRRRSYEIDYDPGAAMQMQLASFNRQWSDICRHVPFYRNLFEKEKLPLQFQSWDSVISYLPIINRRAVQENVHLMIDERKPPQWHRATGGSTAQPIQLPSWNAENTFTTADTWLGRSWYGIKPSDRLFMIWGHSHLLGVGLRGVYNRIVRILKDRLLGYCRFSAYDMSPKSMKEAAKVLINYGAEYVIGYSCALDAFARANRDRADQIRSLRIKAVIGAAEGFPAADSYELIEGVFGAPVAMEYGSVETGLMGHTAPEGGYKAFWHTYFIEATETGISGGGKVRITSLYPRCFPLIRYEIGDEIELYPGDSPLGVRRFKRVIGRCNDYLDLPDGSKVHSELITHAVRNSSEITGYQAIQNGETIKLTVTSANELTNDTVNNIRHRLKIINPYFASIEIERVEALQQSLAGKKPIVIRR